MTDLKQVTSALWVSVFSSAKTGEPWYLPHWRSSFKLNESINLKLLEQPLASHLFHPTLHTQSVQLSSVAQSCPTLGDIMNCSTPSFPVLHYLPEFAQTLLSQWYHPIILILCRPFLLMPSIFPSIRVFCTSIYFKKTLRKPKLFTTKKFQLFEYQ